MLSFEDFLNQLNIHENKFFVDAGNKILKFSLEEITKKETENDDVEIDPNTTIVTGLWDLGREELSDAFKRSYEDYKEKFIELLKIPANMYIYISKNDEEFIWKHRSKKNTVVKFMELNEFDTWFEFMDKVQEIRKKPEWGTQAGWLTESPQVKLKYYNPLVMSKMFLLNDATFSNPFNSKYFYWLDAGITNTVHPGYFTHDKVHLNFPKLTNHINKFLFIAYPYEYSNEIHGFERKALAEYCNVDYVKYVCRGGFFGGTIEQINKLNSIYYSILNKTLSDGYMGTEETIFSILAYNYTDLTYRYKVENTGLLWPFFNKLKNIDELIKILPNQQINNCNLYVLGFNSPHQFKLLCESIKSADINLFNNTRKILVNNSIDKNTFEEYDELCKVYDFEEIHKDNIGVCGGRQFIAEHFDESSADFYLFFEDDMFMNGIDKIDKVCKCGFRQYIPDIYKHIIDIMWKEKFDFIKLSFAEFYGDNSTQWAWYNVPQQVRTEQWPDYDKLPETGLDINAPKTKYKNIKYLNETAYATGEIYYSNWPQIVSRNGNKKMFLDTKWASPFEQTWMSHIYQETIKGNINAGILLASPIDHTRLVHYDASIRREN